ncbi:hypothetical protein PAEPH01_1500 [Pancytospora epiphaga]|nr:hypothetical protein PAEPH01_1500 [Pancytospora epiphaga]
MIVDNEENMPKSSATGTSKFSPTKDQFKQQNSKNIGATVISIPHTLDGDVYLQNLMKVFSREFTQNNNISTSFTTILESKDHILKELTRFDNNFRKFYSTSMNIEKEMASFNANPRYFQYEVSDMSSALKEALSVTTVLDYLNYKNGSDLELNKIFQSEKARQRRSFNVVENVNSYFWLRCMRICAAIQIALGFTLLIVILYEIEFISVLVFFTFLLLFVNAMFSLYVMALAQTLDRMCILWNVDGCPSGYTEGFTRFAATANLDMSSKGHSLQIGEALNKIEVRTAKVVEILREYIQGNPRGRFEYRAMVVQNLFDKIFFVRDEFRKLTNNQVDKESFYKNLDEMDQEIHALRKNIEQLKNDDLLDFYTREVIFLNFIRGEKRNLLRHISDQFNSGGIKGTGICAVRRARICANKALVDRLSALMLIGSIILAVLYCI